MAEKNSKKKPASSFTKYIIACWVVVFLFALGFCGLILSVYFGWWGELPSFEELENPKSSLASEIYSADGVLLGKYYFENRSESSWQEISPNLINALIATEDARFKDHSGIDAKGMFRVFFKTILLRQKSAGGGSTISQQLAKNLFPRKKFNTVSDKIITKLKEWITAIKLERSYTKTEIINMYLNTVPFSENAFGVKSASRIFFNKSPDSLKVEEAALLVGMLKASTLYNPRKNPKNSLERRNVVISQMHKYGFLKKETADSIEKMPIKLDYKKIDHNEGLAPYFREYLRLELNEWCKENKKPDGSQYNLYKDGLKIYTTIHSKMQQYAEEAMLEHMPRLQAQFDQHWKGKDPLAEFPEIMTIGYRNSERYISLKSENISPDSINQIFHTPIKMTAFSWQGEIDTLMSPWDSIHYFKNFLQTGLMCMEPQTGFVRAWVGGINHRYFQYDHVNINTKRQVGSTFKPFVYTVAIDNGFSPCMEVPNVPVTFEEWDNWTPENSDGKYGGMMTLKYGLANSINTITAYLMKQIGPQPIVDLARKLGITSTVEPYPSICLGTADISVYEMTGAFAAYSNKGVRTKPIYFTRIEDKNGNVIQNFTTEQVESISEQTAYVMLTMLEDVMNRGTGAGIRGRYKLYNQIAGKTGTTQNHSDGWFIGSVPQLTTGVWVGGDDRPIHFRALDLGQGARMAMPIWALFMQKIYADSSLNISEDAKFEAPAIPLTIEMDCSKYEKGNKKENKYFGERFE